MTAQWLREKSTFLPARWEHDAPWLAINDPDQKRHIFHVRGPMSPSGHATVFKMASTLGGNAERSLLTQLFYGDPATHPGKAPAVSLTGAEMAGFSRHYGTRDRAEAQSAVNVLDAGGTKDLCSVWLVGWGPRSICMASPDGQPGDECALCVIDWRYAVRIANVDTVRSPERLLEMTIRATYQLPVLGGSADVRPVFYMNRDARNALKDSGLRVPEDAGVPIMLRGIPIREIDELRSDETRVP